MERVRSPVVGGIFYPDDRTEMLTQLRAWELEPEKGGLARAIIAPHGAWDISGSLAAAAFSAASGRAAGRNGRKGLSTVVVLGPLHNADKEGLFLSNSHYFETPLGNIPVDWEITGKLKACSPLFEVNDIPHLSEHSLEVLLPFVKYCFPQAAIVPVLVGRNGAAAIAALAEALKNVFEPVIEDTLLAVSCNFSKAPNKTTARLFAHEVLRLFTGKQNDELISSLLEGRLNICGGAAAAGLLKSGLLDGTQSHPAEKGMISAKDEDDNTVFYGALSFE